MMYYFQTETDLAAFEEFVKRNGGIYMQSPLWAKVKQEWNSRFFAGFDENNTRVLTALIMERHIPGAGKIWYSPAGAVCDYQNKELLKAFSSFIMNQMKKAGAAAMFFDPCIELRINGAKQERGKAVHDILTNCGFALNPDASNCLYKSPVQLILPLTDETGNRKTPESLLKSFEKGIRYSVRVGENRGLTQKIYTISDIRKNPQIMKDFTDIMHDTSERDDFIERDADYCERLLSVFGDDAMDIMLIYYDKVKDKQLQEERLKRKSELEAALPTAPQKKIRGMTEEIESINKQTEHYEQRLAETAGFTENEICVSGGMTVHYNGMSSCLFGGAKNLLRNNLRASHFFNFRRICHSIERGNNFHDLGYVLLKNVPAAPDGTLGECVPNEDFEGICAFKKSFGADYIEYIGEYVLVADKLKYYSYTHLIEKARKVQSVVNRVIRKRL